MEGTVKYTRLNYFVPVPQVNDLEELNAILVGQCRDDMKRRLRGGAGTKAELLIEYQAAFIPLPPSPFDACRKRSTRASSLSLVRFDDNDYSVPVAYAHHEILAKGYIDRVVLCNKTTIVAEHKRSWGKQGVFFDYRHYLPLLEQKPGSLDHARPMAELHLPECFDTLRRRLAAEEATEGEGLREYIKVLRLLDDYPIDRLKQAVEKGIGIRAHSRDAIAQFLIPRPSIGLATFKLNGCEHLSRVQVDKPNISAYSLLLSPGGTV